jgi:hypothetical protein
MFEACSEFQFGSIKLILIAGNVGKLFIVITWWVTASR